MPLRSVWDMKFNLAEKIVIGILAGIVEKIKTGTGLGKWALQIGSREGISGSATIL